MDFLTSFAVICLCAMILGSICSAIRLPPLLGMLIVGIVMGPYVLDLIAPQILDISADLRQLALIIILLRAGLNLDLKNLKKTRRFCGVSLFCSRIRGNLRICAFRHAFTQYGSSRRGNPRLRNGGCVACGDRTENAET